MAGPNRGIVLAAPLISILLAACGGSPNGATPISPLPPPPPASGGPSANLAPSIEAITVSSERVEVDDEITLTAVVKDEETPLDQLAFQWKAEAGTFSGEGASVKWRAPKDAQTPADYEIALTVTETYGTPDTSGVRPQNMSAAKSPVIRVHNSPKELGDISMRFLSNFADSTVPAATCLRDFSDSCRGKGEEKVDIDHNRAYYRILSSSLELKSVSVAPSRSNANVTVACSFTSRVESCSPSGPSVPACSTVGSTESVKGDCNMTAVYEQKRWWLCDSRFASNGLLPTSMRGFFGRR